jgi:hypothetical protein
MNAKGRRHDIDWLRALGMLTVFLFHCARFFDHDDWHVKNPQLSFGASVFIGVVAQWLMPPFFILSAIASYLAPWPAGVPLKFVAIAGVSFVVIVALYEVFIKRSAALRVFFGLKWKQRRRSDVRDLAQDLA